MPLRQRPLSPHLQIYRPQITSVLSITHRMTGIFISIGAVALVAWLAALAGGEESFQWAEDAVSSVLGQVFLLATLAAFWYHFCNGIRHLAWDAGKGLDLANVHRTGIVVIVFTLLLTAATWLSAFYGD